MIFISIYEIKNTYGLFESKKEIDIDKSVAKWNIYINDNNRLITFIINPIVPLSLAFVANTVPTIESGIAIRHNSGPSIRDIIPRIMLIFPFSFSLFSCRLSL